MRFWHFAFETRLAPQRLIYIYNRFTIYIYIYILWTSQFPKVIKSAPNMVCFEPFDFKTRFVPQRRAIFDLSSDQMAPHPPLKRAYFSTSRSRENIWKTTFRDFSTFLRTCIFLLLALSLLWFFLLRFSSLTLSTSAFPSVHIVRSLTSKFLWVVNVIHSDTPAVNSIGSSFFMREILKPVPGKNMELYWVVTQDSKAWIEGMRKTSWTDGCRKQAISLPKRNHNWLQ